MHCSWKAEKDIEINYCGIRKRDDGSIFSKLLHGAGIPFRAHYNSQFKHHFTLLTGFWFLLKLSESMESCLGMVIAVSAKNASYGKQFGFSD